MYRLLVESAAETGFRWDSRQLGWERLGLHVLSNSAGPVQHFRAAVLEAWRGWLLLTYVSGRAFVGPALWGQWWFFLGGLVVSLLRLMSGLMGSLVQDEVSGASSGSFFFFAHRPGRLWAGRRWGHLHDGIGGDRANRSCRGYCSVPGPLRNVQRAKFWCVMLALQAADGIHLGVDDLSVVRHVGPLLDGNVGSRTVELVKDGGLVLLIGQISEMRGRDTVRISEVMMRVWFGRVGFVSRIA